jgi:hypothetical protein
LRSRKSDPEVAELELVGEVDDLGELTNSRGPQLVVDIEDVLEGRALTRARAMAHADNEGLTASGPQHLDDLGERSGRLGRVPGGADRPRVATIGPQALGGPEVQPRSGGVDEIVVPEPSLLADARRVGVDNIDGTARVLRVTLGPDRDGLRLMVLDAFAAVDRRQREDDLLGRHPPHADPDVRRDPVPVGVRRHDNDVMVPAELAAQMQRRRMSGDSCAEDDDPGHVLPPSTTVSVDPKVPGRKRAYTP